MTNQIEENSEVFIGARALKEQIKLILPTYNLLLDQINQIRTSAKNNKDNIMSKRENNNTIGVFGSRGTGKTSVLYTIIEKIGEEKKLNIILPIIEPDNFGQNTKIMGSIIGFLSDVVDDELDKIKKITDSECRDRLSQYFNNCIYKENNPLKLKRDELIEYHLYTENEYRTLLTHNFDDTATHIKKSSYLLKPDIEFKKKLTTLIDLIIKTRREFEHCQDTPLIFIFIDDIDLKTKKCKELVDSILQYANHPNVVTILSGDYNILKESLTLALIADENLKQSNLYPDFKINSKDTIFERKKYLSNEYLKKIIPPARRHYVINWNVTTIPNFAFGNKTLSMQLDELMGNNNFFGYKLKNEIVPIKYSYSIFDKTPRGLVNVYYHIHQIITSKEKDTQSSEELFKNVKSLIDTIIISSRELVDEQKKFFEKCLLWGNNAESTFIDYNQISMYDKIDDLDNKSKYKINKNLFDFFIICEILRELIKNINYNENDYYRIKNLILKVLYLDPKDKLINVIKINEYDIMQKNNIPYIINVVLPIAKNTDLKSALLLLEYLTSGKFKEEYYYNEPYKKNYIYEKDRNAFLSIYKLINQSGNENLLKDLYLKNYDDNESPLKDTFEFLTNICTTTEEYSINEKIFYPLIESALKEFDYSDNLLKMLLVNTLIKIQKSKEKYINKIFDVADFDKKYIKQYRLIKTFNSLDRLSTISDRQKSNIKKIIENLGVHIGKLLKEQHILNLQINNKEKFEKEKDNFIKGESGFTNTIYSQTKYNIRRKNFSNTILYLNKDSDINNRDYTVYSGIFNEIKKLSNNNRVWYGRQEATKFLEILKQEFSLNIEVLKHLNPLICELGIYLKNVNPTITEDIEFENNKKDMKYKLANAFKSAKQELQFELEEIGSDLEEEENNY